MLVLDTDAASVIAKGELVDPLLKAYPRVVITPAVEKEIKRPFEHVVYIP